MTYFKEKKFLNIVVAIITVTLSFPVAVFAVNGLPREVRMPGLILMSSPAVIKPAPGTYSYAGTIKSINSSSITLYHGQTCIITGATVCKAPMSGGNMMNMQTVSCSSFTKGETVQISAVKNSSGELVATLIQEAFF